MRNMLENINKKAKGKRYSSFTKSFYEVVKIWGCKKMLKILSLNGLGIHGGGVEHRQLE